MTTVSNTLYKGKHPFRFPKTETFENSQQSGIFLKPNTHHHYVNEQAGVLSENADNTHRFVITLSF